jgi:thiol-disulfide isomerase/thioredoxin
MMNGSSPRGTALFRLVLCWITTTLLATKKASAYMLPRVPSQATAPASSSRLHMVDPWRDPEQNSIPIVIDGKMIVNISGDNNAPSKEEDPVPAAAKFGESVPLSARNKSTKIEIEEEEEVDLAGRRRKNLIVAGLAIVLAISNYSWQLLHPVTPLQLLATMQQRSSPVTIIGSNDKPTVVDFWAPFCGNCKVMAPTLQALELQYKDRVNFVMVNGGQLEARPLVNAFGVDAIPHLALVSADGLVETALIGIIPKHVLAADLDVLLQNAASCSSTSTSTTSLLCAEPRNELPYRMLDVFAGRPAEQRRVHFEDDL